MQLTINFVIFSYDFFLVSQHVRYGTVMPTHYIIVHDSSGWDTDKLQRLTYKLTHLYYNWTGTVRVPAPVQVSNQERGIGEEMGESRKGDGEERGVKERGMGEEMGRVKERGYWGR